MLFRTELYLSLIYLDIRNLLWLQGGGAGGVHGVEWGLSRRVGVRALSLGSLREEGGILGGMGESVGFYISTKTDCRKVG